MSMVGYTDHNAPGGSRPRPAATHARQHKSCGNSVAATVHGAYWCPFRLSMTSKPQAWFSLKTQSPSTLGWRLSVKVSHISRFERTVTLAHTNRPHGQSPLPERARAAERALPGSEPTP
jgi:hypothetical protein